MRYIAIIDGEDGAYGAAFPDVPGCVAMAATRDAVIQDAAEALAEWVADELSDGRPLPIARSKEALMQDNEISAALSKGAVLASIPFTLETGKLAS